jgi:ferredoxin--NADP+ reductase
MQCGGLFVAQKFQILKKDSLAPGIKRIVVLAPLIARKAHAGQFVILRIDERGERFPLTLVDWNPEEGSIVLILQEVGASTKKLGSLNIGDTIMDIVGPLGNPTEAEKYGEVAVIGGGVGTALIYPWVRALKEAGNRVITILGARNVSLLLLEEELRSLSDELHVSTDDGTKGFKGFTADILKSLLEKGKKFNLVMAAGPVPMMRAVAEVTRPFKIKTVVSLNPIMVDGTGMCGGCRITVGGETKFACVDGPEFDAHQVDFRELTNRLRTYTEEETKAAAN